MHLVKTARPMATAQEVITFATGSAFSEWDATHCLHDYSPFTTMMRQNIESHAFEGSQILRDSWHTQPPSMGHLGVPTMACFDIDETCFYLNMANRTFGQARPGSTPIESQRHALGEKFTFVLAVDPMGNYACRISTVNLDEALWIDFLRSDLFAVCGPQRVILFGYLRAHARALQVIMQAGNRPRPLCSPWLAPIEFIFGLMEAYLRKTMHLAKPQNFRRCILAACQAAVAPAKSGV